MKKINFQNGVSGNTPLNAENLNQLQSNAEIAIEENASKIGQIETSIEENTSKIGQLESDLGDLKEEYFDNDNGYIRFASGFQICWVTKTVTAGRNKMDRYSLLFRP